MNELLQPTSSSEDENEDMEDNNNEEDEQHSSGGRSPPSLPEGIKIKEEPRKSDGEDEAEDEPPNTENDELAAKVKPKSGPSPGLKRNGELPSNDDNKRDTPRLPSKVSRSSESPGQQQKKIHPDPMGLLVRAFPNHCRSVLELVLQGCGGNVVQAIECLLENREVKKQPIQVPTPVSIIASMPMHMPPIPRDIHPAMHSAPPFFRKPEPFPPFLHKPPSGTRYPPPLLKPKAQLSGYPFSMDAVLATTPPAHSTPGSPKDEPHPLINFCTNCGRRASTSDNFCATCGHKFQK